MAWQAAASLSVEWRFPPEQALPLGSPLARRTDIGKGHSSVLHTIETPQTHCGGELQLSLRQPHEDPLARLTPPNVPTAQEVHEI